MSNTKKTEIPQNVIYFDSEARVEIDDTVYIDQIKAGETVEKIHNTYLICACFTRQGVSKEIWKDYYGPGFKNKFWRAVDQFTVPGRKTWIFAHNAKYDVLATGAAKYLVNLGYTVTGFSDDNPFILSFSKETRGKKQTILILSSTNYYKNSLADLGKTFGIEKKEAAFNDGLEESISYCRTDVEILKVAMQNFIEFIINEDLGTFSQTIAGQSFSAYRHRFNKTDIFIHADTRALKVERAAYCGGRTESWFIGDVPGEVFGLDINSQYPSIMKKEKYPVMLKTIRNRLTPGDALDFIAQGFLIVANCKIKTDIPLYPKKAKRLLFPIGEFETSLATPEIIEGIKRGHILELTEVCIYYAENIFSDFVDYFYNSRLAAKAAGDKVKDLLYKLILNSLYGKFGQKAIQWELVGKAPVDIIKCERVYDVDSGKSKTIKIFGGSIFKNVEKEGNEEEAFNSFPAIAAHVTSYARRLLWTYMEIAGLENVYYMDTDSIFANETGYKNLLAARVVDDKTLGLLKLEKTGVMTIYGVKDYIFNDIPKMKGIPKTAIKLSDTEYLVNTWIGFSKALAAGTVDGYKNIVMKKTLTRTYTKGLISAGGRVLPLRYYDDECYISQDCLNFDDLRQEYCRKEIQAEKDQARELKELHRQSKKHFRKMIREIGGVNDPDFESIPRWALQKKSGVGLDVILEDLKERGYIFDSIAELYEYLWKN